MAAGFDLEDCDKIGRIDQCFIFRPFRVGKIAFVGSLTEQLDPRLYWLIDAEGYYTSGRLRVEAKTKGFQKAVKPGSYIHALTLTQPANLASGAILANILYSG
jgi:hypothetical protein